jgi:hypothetical protein
MRQLIQFALEDGSPVYMEVDAVEEDSQLVGQVEEDIIQAKQSFKEALAHVKPAAETVLNTFREMNAPDEINLEFGLKLSGAVGAIFASAKSEANFRVLLKWKNQP